MPDEKKEEEIKEEIEEKKEEKKEEAVTKGISEGIISGLSKIAGKAGAAKQAIFRNVSGIGFILLLAIILHICDIILFNMPWILRLALYAGLSALSLLFIFGNLLAPLGLLVASYLWPLIPKVFPLDFFQYFIIFTSPWILFLTFGAPKEQLSKPFKLWQAIYTITLFAVLLVWLSGPLREIGVTPEKAAEVTKEAVPPSVLEQTKKTAREIPKKVFDFITGKEKEFIQQATGDYYTGQVEKNKEEPLGVYIENLQPADPIFYEGQKATIWGIIKARTIGNEIGIATSCKADDKIKGKIDPEIIEITALEEKDIKCDFDTLSKGSHRIDVSAEFNFSTMSYLKTYFMDRNRLLSMRAENIDPFEQYKILDRDPTAVYTNGPIGIGMETTKPLPIGIDKGVQFFLGLTIQNRWEGKITKIDRLIIYVPEGFVINVKSDLQKFPCDHLFEEAKFSPEDEDYQEGYKAYVLSDKDPVKKTIANLQPGQWQSFRCRIDVEDLERILGKSPFTISNFKATIYYNYTTKKSISVEVKEGTFSLGTPTFKTPLKKLNSEEIFKRIEQYKSIIESTEGGQDHHELIAAVIAAESAGIPDAESKTGCLGLMQFCGATARDYGLCSDVSCSTRDERTDPKKSILAGSRYLLDLKRKFNEYDDKEKFAIASYNGGSGIILKAIERTGKSNPKWEEVSAEITTDLLKESPDYDGCFRDWCWNDEKRALKVNEIKNYVSIVSSYKDDYKGKFA